MYLQDSLEAYLSIASAKALQDNFLSGKNDQVDIKLFLLAIAVLSKWVGHW